MPPFFFRRVCTSAQVMLRHSSHVSLTGSALLAIAATIAGAVAEGRADEDAVETLVTKPLGIDGATAVLLDMTGVPELLPDPPPAPPVYSGGPGIIYVGKGLIQIS